MSKAGIVFLFLNIVMALVFALATSGVAKKRIDGQKQISDKENQIASTRDAIEKGDWERSRTRTEVQQLQAKLLKTNVDGKNTTSALEVKIADLTDVRNDVNTQVRVSSEALVNIENETKDRNDEIAKVNVQIDEAGKENQALTARKASLEDNLKQTQEGFASTQASTGEAYKNLLDLNGKIPPQSSTESATASR